MYKPLTSKGGLCWGVSPRAEYIHTCFQESIINKTTAHHSFYNFGFYSACKYENNEICRIGIIEKCK